MKYFYHKSFGLTNNMNERKQIIIYNNENKIVYNGLHLIWIQIQYCISISLITRTTYND